MWEDEYFWNEPTFYPYNDGIIKLKSFAVKKMSDVKWNGRFTIWITSEGKRIKLCNMTNRHLINTINMLKRNEYDKFSIVAPRYIELMKMELDFREFRINERKRINSYSVLHNL